MEFFLRQEQKQNETSRRLSGIQRLKETMLIIAILSAIFIGISLMTYDESDPSWSQTGWDGPIQNAAGNTGAWLADSLFFSFGTLAYLLPLIIFFGGWVFFRCRSESENINFMIIGTRLIGINLLLLTSCGLADLNFDDFFHFPSGGVVGDVLSAFTVPMFGLLGTTLILLFLWASGFTLFTGISWLTIVDKIGEVLLGSGAFFVNLFRKDSTRTFKPEYENRFSDDGEGYAYAGLDTTESEDDPLFRPQQRYLSSSGTTAQSSSDHVPPIHHVNRQYPPQDADTKNQSASKVFEQGEIQFSRDEATTNTNQSFDSASRQNSNDHSLPPQQPTESFEFDYLGNKEREVSIGNLDGLSELERAENVGILAEQDPEIPPFMETIRKAQQKEAESVHPFLMRDEPNLPKPVEPLPTLDLLEPPRHSGEGASNEELQYQAQLIEARLEEFKISVTVVGIYPGPVITRFELELAPGVKVSRIMTLAKDIARSLSTSAVRVVDVIPGKPFVGLELPNDNRETVFMSEVVASDRFQHSISPLSVVLGKDIAGEAIVTDLAKAPHMLVAGTTGSGKSVGVNVMIVSMLYKASPEEVRFIMIDPKMLELSVYEGIPHLLTEVVTDMKDAANALRWCVGEMERRYKLMSMLGVRNIAGYNERIQEANAAGMPIPDPLWEEGDSIDGQAPNLENLPFIVVIVDEFADLMMVVGKKVEELIARLAQKARAAGIHLVLATQRPSVDVITGLIKANIPTRMAFTVSTKTDSRTILDQGGAESLLGMGDMLFMPNGSNHPVRVHGAFVSDDEVHRVVNNWKARGKPNYISEITSAEQGADSRLPGETSGESDAEQLDQLYDQVFEFVTETRRASVSGVQRRFKVGYNRAARIIDQLEAQGVVSPPGQNSNREVLAPPPAPSD